MGHPIRVMLVDGNTMIRKALAKNLQGEVGIEVVLEAGDGQEAVELLDWAEVDAITMDISMKPMGGVEPTSIICRKRPGIRIIGLSMHDHSDSVVEAMYQGGARAYVQKERSSWEIVEAIRGAEGPSERRVS